MGCGTSSSVVPQEDPKANCQNGLNGQNGHQNGSNGHGDRHDDGLPTVVLPDTPVKPKPPISFEIPVEEFAGGHRASPPPHLHRLLQPPQPEITLPHIEEKLAEAEMRRQSILQQRAASAQKKSQRIMRQINEIDFSDEHESIKHGCNTVTIPAQQTLGDLKSIT